MSHTDKTRPARVKALDLPTFLKAAHDHRSDDPCDLPLAPALPARGAPRTRCTWEETRAFWADPQNGCGCGKCTDQVQRKARARRDRSAARRYTAEGWRSEH